MYMPVHYSQDDLGIVSVNQFGAKGDGITDDTQSFKSCISYAEQNNKIVIIPEGSYLISSTLKVDVEKTSIIGVGSSSTLVVNTDNSFAGTTVLQVYSGIGDWQSRKLRMRTLGKFSIINKSSTRKLIALSMSGPKGSVDEGHVETIHYQEMFIEGFDIAIEYGEHVYKTISERLYTKSCNYAIKSVSGQADAGEVPVWRGCFFVDDSCRMELYKDTYFEHCSFHPNPKGVTHAIKVSNNATMTISNCHFEHISSEDGTIYKDPWFYIESGSVINIRDCFGVASGTSAKSYFKKCVIENNGHLYIDSPLLSNLLLRCKFDETSIASTTNKRGSFIYNGVTGHSRVIKLARKINTSSDELPLIDNNTIIRNYNFENMTTSEALSIFTFKKQDPSNRLDNYTGATISPSIMTDPTSLSKYSSKVLNINSVQGAGVTSYYVGTDLEIPSESDVVSLLTRCWKVGGTNIQFNQSYMFFDNFGNRIPDSIILSYNDNISTYVSKTADSDVLESSANRTYRKIPKEAKYVFVGVQVVQSANTTANYYFDYFIPQFI
ncbi:hypothetical protein CEW46_26730 [Bacillus cereus]|nr:hypothetical protein CEW46_26730 [Bacillus cereus]